MVVRNPMPDGSEVLEVDQCGAYRRLNKIVPYLIRRIGRE